jgi:hypothetical protein
MKIKLLFILRNAQGQPIDAFEYSPYIRYKHYIKLFLAKYTEAGFRSSIGRERVSNLKKEEKLEIRILNFSIKE